MELNTVNDGKNELIEVEGILYRRLAIKTNVITVKDVIADVASKYVLPHIEANDIVFISEKSVACSQKRAVKMVDIKPRKLAVTLSKYVYKSPYGIGLGIPETMEMALVECGTLRILFAAFCSAVTKVFKMKGVFYHVAGRKAASIDGPTPYTLPPYNEYVVLGPKNPDAVAKSVKAALGVECAIIDVNDLSGVILGVSNPNMDKELLVKILRDNPLGQSHQQTPMGIIRVTKG